MEAGRLTLAAAIFLTVFACGGQTLAPTVQLLDRDRYARLSADARTIVYYRHDERPGATAGIYGLDVTTGADHLLRAAVLAGLDLNPKTDSVMFSALGSGEAEPSLWLMGLDGGGLRRVAGGGVGPGYRWPAFSADGRRLTWERRYQNQTGLDTVNTLWIGDWEGGAITNARPVGSAHRASWRPDGAALAVERRRPADATPPIIAIMDTSGQLLDTLGFGYEPVWRPDGQVVAYLAETADRGCLGVCFVPAGGGSPTPLSSDFMSFPGTWSSDGASFVYSRLMRTYTVDGSPPLSIEESRLWIRTLATGTDRQLRF